MAAGGDAVKRLLDVAIACVGLAVASPALFAVAVLIRATMGSPVLYRQTRPGKDGKLFKLMKFRTMTDARGADGKLFPDAQRQTRLGKLLRRFSVDEFPQFFNVLKGDMSLVGPRPLLVRYILRYSPRQRLRLAVKPGITGWAQVNGRNALDWDTKLEMDVWYVENRSLWLDLKIIAKTFGKVLGARDVKEGAGAELEEFWGAAGPPETGPLALPVEQDESLDPTPRIEPGGARP
jgi:lipopolysaccharide/colanic/teichoic acid biosynthesis glycosyltransferase